MSSARSSISNLRSRCPVPFVAAALGLALAVALLLGTARAQDARRLPSSYSPYAATSITPGLRAAGIEPPRAVPAQWAAAPAPGSQRLAYQRMTAPLGTAATPDETAQEYQIPLEPPGPDRIFRLESESQLMERMRQEARHRRGIERITFPDEPVLSTDVYAGRDWPQSDRPVEPNYVVYGRLLFEQKNFERYGWDLGPITPFVSAAGFLGHFATLPYNRFTDPCRCYDASAGYCLPGDPVPLLLYPPGLSVTGGIAEAAAVLAIVAIFP